MARHHQFDGIGHTLKEGDYVRRVLHPFQVMGPPIDAALARIDRVQFEQGDKLCVPASRIGFAHTEVSKELLFILGLPGALTRMSAFAGGLHSGGLPYLTQECPLPSGHDARYAFAIHYPWDKALLRSDGGTTALPDPHGLSGSLVWDTKVVAGSIRSPGAWTPAVATVTGLIHSWDLDSHALIATRIEIVRAFMIRALRAEFAYFRWLSRGSPTNDALADWVEAERAIGDIE